MLFALLCVGFPLRESVEAGVWDNARDFYDTYGNTVVFRPTTATDGILYAATVGAIASGGTRYKTIGWKVSVTDGNGNLLQTVYYAVGGSYLGHYSVVAQAGYEYNLYGFSLSGLKGRLSAGAYSALLRGNCRIRLDACMVVTQGGTAQGGMNDSGSFWGNVYTSYGGISSAMPWTESSKTALYSYFDKQAQGLFYTLTVSGGTGIRLVSGGGTYCYGTPVSVSCEVAYGYEFAGWRGTDWRGSCSFTTTVNGSYHWEAYASPKWTQITFYRNSSEKDDTAQSETYRYGSAQVLGSNVGWQRPLFHAIGWSVRRCSQPEMRHPTGNLISYGWWAPVSGDWIVEHHTQTIPLYCVWKINHYYFTFDANKGRGGSVPDMEADGDEELRFPENGFEKPVDNCTFVGWDLNPDALSQRYDAGKTYPVQDPVTACGRQYEDGAHLTLYAIWDYAPEIETGDLYYSVSDADAGKISQEELIRFVSVTDREDGTLEWSGLAHLGEDQVNGFYIADYPADGFAGRQEGCYPVTFVAVDHVGNETQVQIQVHLVDTTVKLRSEAAGRIRFIDEEHMDVEHGGLSEDSVWKRRADYRSILERALADNKKGNPKVP